MNLETANIAYGSHKKKEERNCSIFLQQKLGVLFRGFFGGWFGLVWVFGVDFFFTVFSSLINSLLNSSEDHPTENEVKS